MPYRRFPVAGGKHREGIDLSLAGRGRPWGSRSCCCADAGQPTPSWLSSAAGAPPWFAVLCTGGQGIHHLQHQDHRHGGRRSGQAAGGRQDVGRQVHPSAAAAGITGAAGL